ncbi:MAG: DUF5753 domain-containing protein [Actinomycetota bacterium]|nr:DUF5753 domain-containing protein [Actinomycetota bacterium]
MENGERTPQIEDVAALLAVYRVTGPERDEILALTRASVRGGLWQPHGTPHKEQASSLQRLEARATVLVSYELVLVPGLLQTVPYAQTMMSEIGKLTDQEEIERRVADRIQRQAVLHKQGAPHLFAIIPETVLRTAIGGREVMHDQLRYLIEAGTRKNVTIRVIPESMHGHPGFDGQFLRIQFAHRKSVVFLSMRTSSLFVEDEDEVAVYDRVIADLLRRALPEDESLERIGALADELYSEASLE